MMRKFLSRENLYAVLLCMIAIALIIATSSSEPIWIYQGF